MHTLSDRSRAPGLLAPMGVLRFTGPDAATFLQGQVSQDTRRLSAGSPLLAAYSTPQGRVVALLHLLPHSSGILALLPREIARPTLERLRKFVLRAKVHIEDLSERWGVAGIDGADALAASGLAVPAEPGYAERDGIGIGRRAAHSTRYWVVGEASDLARGLGIEVGPQGAMPPADAQRVEFDWRLADIREGLPQVYAATREMFVAQMLNLDLIDGISFTKGCFTGQEIIARTQHLGRIKRRLFRLRLPSGTWAIGQAVHLADGRSGRLTELVGIGAEFEALAVLSLEPARSTVGTEGSEVALETVRGTTGTIEAGEPRATSAGAAADGIAVAAELPVVETGPLVEALELPLPYALTQVA